MHHYVDHQSLTLLGPGRSATLRAHLARIWPRPAGLPVSIRPFTDVTGCTTLVPLTRELDLMRDAWRRAPDCLKVLVRPALDAVLADIGQSQCLCESRAQFKAQHVALTKATARLDASLDGLGRAPPGPRRFDCRPN